MYLGKCGQIGKLPFWSVFDHKEFVFIDRGTSVNNSKHFMHQYICLIIVDCMYKSKRNEDLQDKYYETDIFYKHYVHW